MCVSHKIVFLCLFTIILICDLSVFVFGHSSTGASKHTTNTNTKRRRIRPPEHALDAFRGHAVDPDGDAVFDPTAMIMPSFVYLAAARTPSAPVRVYQLVKGSETRNSDKRVFELLPVVDPNDAFAQSVSQMESESTELSSDASTPALRRYVRGGGSGAGGAEQDMTQVECMIVPQTDTEFCWTAPKL
jgi:hypothetical protein